MARCESLRYLEGSTTPDKILHCARRAQHKGKHRHILTSWTNDQEWQYWTTEE